MLMSREKVQFPSKDAHHQGLTLLGDAVAIDVRNEERRIVAAGEIPSRLRSGLAELGAIFSEDDRLDSEEK
jgi:hypothetical protein